MLKCLFYQHTFGCYIGLQVFQIVKRPLPIILGAVAQYFLMPFYGFLWTQILALEPQQAFGFVMTCTCPGGVGLFFLLLEGNFTLAILITCASAFLALIMMLANSYIYCRMLRLSCTFHTPVSKIIMPFILISVGIVNCRIPEKANFLERIIRTMNFILISVGI
ncbi:LOW QUALITY PROTEIN: sodium/bile acid cotransporter 5 [Lycaon pictus]